MTEYCSQMDFADLEAVSQEFLSRDISSPDSVQAKLNIEDRKRTSMFAWRGQFSPQLIDFLMGEYASNAQTIFDPFCGSGTTLTESLRRGINCCGYDINPAAFLLTSINKFSNLDESERKSVIASVSNALALSEESNLFSQDTKVSGTDNIFDSISRLENLENLLASVVVMQALGDSRELLNDKLLKSLRACTDIVLSLPRTDAEVNIQAADSRYTNLESKSIDFVVTSPPYINVFNYHQNYRPALEFLGWTPLSIANTEIGANRKHRQNRFLTVTQYCIDMCLCLNELSRVLKETGRAVFIVGRCSSVRGVTFQNGLLLALLAETASGFEVEHWRERHFTNRFGEAIYEDILTLRKSSRKNLYETPLQAGRTIGQWVLEKSASSTEGEIATDIQNAIERAANVMPSPSLTVEQPLQTKSSNLVGTI